MKLLQMQNITLKTTHLLNRLKKRGAERETAKSKNPNLMQEKAPKFEFLKQDPELGFVGQNPQLLYFFCFSPNFRRQLRRRKLGSREQGFPIRN